MTHELTPGRPSIAYDRTGSGTPMVFVHGLTYDRRMWVPVIERLSEFNTCINIDLPGHGQSPEAEAYDLETVARNIHELVEQLKLSPPIMIGHSLGGIIATVYASAYPATALVTSDQPLRTIAFLERIRGIREQLQGPEFPGTWRAIERELRIDLIPEQYRNLVETGLNPRQKTVLGYWREAFEIPPAELQGRLVEAVHRIDVPFTAIFGQEVGPGYRSWLSTIAPQCNVTVFPNAGHFPHLVNPDRFADEVRAVAYESVRT